MPDKRKELLRRFYLQLELMCAHGTLENGPGEPLRLGNLYDDQAPTIWGARSGGPFSFSLHG
jgi:hypothetical protein